MDEEEDDDESFVAQKRFFNFSVTSYTFSSR